MRITAVSLKNVKSYQEATVPFPPGTVAISGPNGAGKSTILEAIGFALFDFLPYRNQREFMRHNATEADVRVTFLSRLDECEYQAVRTLKRATGSADTVTSSYFVYSFDTHEQVARQKEEVQAFLRRHVGLDDYDDLARVFADVLGVPQGRLTADFLLTPAQRKQTFDPLLRVDAYRRVFAKLRDVLDALQGKVAEHERQVSGLEPQAARLPDALSALAQHKAEYAEAAAQSSALSADLKRLQADLSNLETQRRALEQQRGIAKQLTQQQENLQKRLETERAQVAAARQAAARTHSAKAGYAAYREAQDTLATLEGERKDADALRATERTLENKLVALETQRAALRKGVEEASQAAARIAALAPDVARQEELEARAREFGQDLGFARQLGRQINQALRRLTASAPDERLAFAEGPLPVETDKDAARARAKLAEQYERLQEVAPWLQQRDGCRRQLRQSRPEREQVAQAVARCRTFLEAAARLPDLETELQSVQEKIGAYQAQRRFNEHSRSMAADGLCPFFQDQCPKVDDGHSLIPVIATLIRDYADHAAQALTARKKLASEVAKARAAQQEANRLTDLEPRLRQLDDEMLALTRQERDLTQRIDARLREIWRPEAIAETLSLLEGEEESLAQQLKRLGNPRQEVERLHGAAGEHKARTQALDAVSTEHERVAKELAHVAARLEPYADLGNRLTAQRTLIETHRHAHDTYLRYQETAADLPRREEAERVLASDVEENERALRESAQTLAASESAWDPAALAGAQAGVNRTQGRLGAANERSRFLSERIAAARREIAELEEAARALEEARIALAEAREVRAVTGFLRDVIRDAGPHVARHLIQQVSAEANTLFSEIMGDASAELSLTEDYDILLEQHGHRRGFMQLSGGEQMSAALAVRLGLLRQLSDLDIAFFDEPTQNMDVERRHNLAEQLERVTGFHQLFVISHDDTFEPLVSTVLRVRKENGVSTVEQL